MKVNGKTYYSVPTTYEVREIASSSDFSLEAFVEGPTTCYPGQKTTLCYRICYKNEIEVTFQYMPLLEAHGLRRIGEHSVKSFFEHGCRIQEIRQQVETVEPGDFTYDSSIIEGFTFKEGFFGRRQYNQTKMRAETSPLTIHVNAFPENQKPKSFMGASGEFIFEVKMLTPQKNYVGDKIKLEITISGRGNLDNLRLPDIARQKGFSDFRFNDLSPVGKIQGLSKIFILELRPLSPNIEEIPSIEFSFFDPVMESYKVMQSEPFFIEVEERKITKHTIVTKSIIPEKNDSKPQKIRKRLLYRISKNCARVKARVWRKRYLTQPEAEMKR